MLTKKAMLWFREQYLTDKENMSECYSQFMGIYSDNFKKGLPLNHGK